jgi:hypothetical protein
MEFAIHCQADSIRKIFAVVFSASDHSLSLVRLGSKKLRWRLDVNVFRVRRKAKWNIRKPMGKHGNERRVIGKMGMKMAHGLAVQDIC